MKKIIVFMAVILIFASCATIKKYQKTYRQELAGRDNKLFGPSQPNSNLDMITALYAYAIIKNPSVLYRSFYYPVWPYYDLMVYEEMLKSIHRMEMFKLEMEVRRLIEELKRAKKD